MATVLMSHAADEEDNARVRVASGIVSAAIGWAMAESVASTRRRSHTSTHTGAQSTLHDNDTARGSTSSSGSSSSGGGDGDRSSNTTNDSITASSYTDGSYRNSSVCAEVVTSPGQTPHDNVETGMHGAHTPAVANDMRAHVQEPLCDGTTDEVATTIAEEDESCGGVCAHHESVSGSSIAAAPPPTAAPLEIEPIAAAPPPTATPLDAEPVTATLPPTAMPLDAEPIFATLSPTATPLDAEPSGPCYFAELPTELCLEIFSYFSHFEVVSTLGQVCLRWLSIAKTRIGQKMVRTSLPRLLLFTAMGTQHVQYSTAHTYTCSTVQSTRAVDSVHTYAGVHHRSCSRALRFALRFVPA
jgi:hypothetical protein